MDNSTNLVRTNKGEFLRLVHRNRYLTLEASEIAKGFGPAENSPLRPFLTIEENTIKASDGHIVAIHNKLADGTTVWIPFDPKAANVATFG